MKYMSRPLVIIILFLAAFGIGLGLRAVLVPKQTPPAPSVRPAEPPRLPSPVVTGQPRYIISQKQEFPSLIPGYTINKKADAESITQNMGRLLNLTGSPSPSAGSQGIYFYWNTKTQSLTVGGDPVNIAYSDEKGPSDKITVAEADLSQTAVSFLARLGIPPAPLSLKKTGSVYMQPEKQDPHPVSLISDATLVQLSYQFAVDGYPIYTNPPSVPGAEVSLNGKGEIGSFRAFWIPNFTKDATDIAVVSYDEAVRRLSSFQGILASVETEGATSEVLLTAPPDISTIFKTELGYYYAPDQQTLSPVFVFYGKGAQGSLSLQTITLVSAAPDEPPLKTVP